MSTANFFYRTKSKNCNNVDATGNDKFLLVHQEVWQQRLLSRYGSDLVLIDATYKTTKYALPLFFICVHTNVGYKVVAEFICENEHHKVMEYWLEPQIFHGRLLLGRNKCNRGGVSERFRLYM